MGAAAQVFSVVCSLILLFLHLNFRPSLCSVGEQQCTEPLYRHSLETEKLRVDVLSQYVLA